MILFDREKFLKEMELCKTPAMDLSYVGEEVVEIGVIKAKIKEITEEPFDYCSARNIVQVRHVEDKDAKRYTFEIPMDEELRKGQTVLLDTSKGEKIGICVTHSEIVSDNIIDMMMNGLKLSARVIGVLELKKYAEQE